MKNVLIGAALIAAQLAASAPANAAGEPGDRRRDVRVKIADLDLSTREGVAALDRRLAQAIVKACGTAHYLEPEALDEVDNCRADARERAMATRNAILRREIGGPAPAAGAFK